MKNVAIPKPVQLDEKTSTQLVTEVKETLATDANVNNKKFTAADMWNSHRNRRSASMMIRRWNLN